MAVGLEHPLARAALKGRIGGRPILHVDRQRARQLERAVMRLGAQRDGEVEIQSFPVVELLDRLRLVGARIDAADIPRILGSRRFEAEHAQRTSVAGVATGLAWTPVGGDILFIEATRTPGNGRLILTGQLGEVMKESAQAALSLAKSKYRELGLDAKLFEASDIHVHVPAGAVPKDGPSAGVAMFTALASLLTARPVRSDLAMTGEISLRGLVLPVGGIKEKVLAAMLAGIKTVMLPARNRKDWDDIPEVARQALEFVWLETVDEALSAALQPAAPKANAA